MFSSSIRRVAVCAAAALPCSGLLARAVAPQGPGASNAPVVINEFNPDDWVNPDVREFIELYNRSGAPVDIGGWIVDQEDWQGALANNQDFPIPPGTVLAPGDYYVIAWHNSILPANVIDQYAPLIPASPIGMIENADEGLTLRNAQGVIVDAVYFETYYTAQGGFRPPAYLIEGQGIWGTNISPQFGPTSWQRLSDGYDTDNNGRDFRVGPITPGASNDAPLQLPYVADMTPPAGTVPFEWRSTTTLENPAVVNARNPAAIPPSPAGSPGSRVLIIGATSGGTHSMLWVQPAIEVELEAWVYIDATPEATHPTTLASEGSYWSLGIMGHSDGASTFPDIHPTLGSTQNGDVGVTLTFVKDNQGATLYLIDNNDGGVDETVLGQIAIMPGVNDGWQRVRLQASATWAELHFGGTYGGYDGTVLQGPVEGEPGGIFVSTRTIRLGGGTPSIPARAFTVDALAIRTFDDGLATFGAGVASSAGVPSLGAVGFPWVGNAGFGFEFDRLVANAPFTLMFGINTPPAPIDLTVIGGQPGATLWFSSTTRLDGVASAAGTALIPLGIPAVPAIVGATIIGQQFQIDLGIQAALPISHSAALQATFQSF